jgi:hypothetical protein
MSFKDIDKNELIDLVALAVASDQVEAYSRFSTLVEWLNNNATDEDRDRLITDAQKSIQASQMVQIDRADFISLYAHTQAVLGFEESKHRFPRLRLLLLNLMDDKELESTMNLIRSIQERIKNP